MEPTQSFSRGTFGFDAELSASEIRALHADPRSRETTSTSVRKLHAARLVRGDPRHWLRTTVAKTAAEGRA